MIVMKKLIAAFGLLFSGAYLVAFLGPQNPRETNASFEQKTTSETRDETQKEAEIPSKYCIKDEYFNFVQNQTNTGLCWNYGASMALSYTFAKALNEFNDFSEVWVSAIKGNTDSYVPNAGGWDSSFNAAVKKYGLVYEQDLQATEAWLTAKDKLDSFVEFYSKDVNKILYKNIANVSYTKSTKVNEIKRHIMEHGGMSMSASWKTTNLMNTTTGKLIYAKVPNEKNVSGAHAVCLMGWDDEISIVSEGVTYTGAWIVQNSFGERELNQGGTTYLFYDDKQIYNSVTGYKVVDNTAEDTGINFLSRIESSNAKIINKYVGSFFENTPVTSKETKQKNIFYGQNVDLNYSYTISPETTIKDISVYNCDIDVTPYFDIRLDQENQTYSLKNYSGYPLDYGSYKVKIELSRGDNIDYAYNTFYLVSGAETNSMFLASINGTPISTERNQVWDGDQSKALDPITFVENNGYYFLFNSGAYSKNIRNFRTSTPTTEGFFDLDVYTNLNDDVVKVEFNGNVIKENLKHEKERITVPYSGLGESNKTSYNTLSFIAANGKRNDIPFIIDYTKATDKYVYLKMDTDGGINPNINKFIHKNGDNFTLKAPTREGYKFAGWFYDRAFTNPLSKQGDEYLFDDSNLVYLGDCNSKTLYSYWYYHMYYCRTYTGYVYAKWELDPLANLEFISPNKIYVNGNTPFVLETNGVNAPGFVYSADLYVDGEFVDTFDGKRVTYVFKDRMKHTVSIEAKCLYKGQEFTKRSADINVEAENESSQKDQYFKVTGYGDHVNFSGTNKKYLELTNATIFISSDRGYLPCTQVKIVDLEGNEEFRDVVDGKVVIFMKGNVSIYATAEVDVNVKFFVKYVGKAEDFEGIREFYNAGDDVSIKVKSSDGKKIENVIAVDDYGNKFGEYNKKTSTISFKIYSDVKLVIQYKQPINVNTVVRASIGGAVCVAIIAISVILFLKKKPI